jgi:hypothetical protein
VVKKTIGRKLQNGHFMSRANYSTRWDEDNCQVQCMGCNVFKQGEQYKYSLYLGNKLAEELYIKIKTNS